jgi:hypothetical protein
MASYLTVAEFKLRTIMPQTSVDALEVQEPGYLAAALEQRSDWINARLRKRYAAPFVLPYPPVVLAWLTAMVTLEAYGKLGWNPASKSDEASIITAATDARDEVKEAADSKEGLFDLPITTGDSSGVTKGGPLSYSEASPYVWTTLQAETGRGEDQS